MSGQLGIGITLLPEAHLHPVEGEGVGRPGFLDGASG